MWDETSKILQTLGQTDLHWIEEDVWILKCKESSPTSCGFAGSWQSGSGSDEFRIESFLRGDRKAPEGTKVKCTVSGKTPGHQATGFLRFFAMFSGGSMPSILDVKSLDWWRMNMWQTVRTIYWIFSMLFGRMSHVWIRGIRGPIKPSAIALSGQFWCNSVDLQWHPLCFVRLFVSSDRSPSIWDSYLGWSWVSHSPCYTLYWCYRFLLWVVPSRTGVLQFWLYCMIILLLWVFMVWMV